MCDYYNPVKVIKTDNWLDELNLSIEKLKITAPVIVTSPGNRRRLDLDSKFNSDSIFSDVRANPNFEDCVNAIKFCRKNIFDGVVALGGGSAMDLAKVVMAYLCLEKPDVNELINHKGDFPRTIPSIFLPTTHGTASEVTMWGTVWNMTEKKKYSISHPELYPTFAILDGNLTMSLPLDISITTVMDALSHSFEAIWNKNSNKVSTKHAIKAICAIIRKIDSFKTDPYNLKIRSSLLHASNLAGLAFSNTKTAAAHSISYPLTIYYGIPHGVASSICLVPLLRINKKSILSSLNIICQKNKITFLELVNKIKSIPSDIIPYKMKNWGVCESQLDDLVEESFTYERMDNNIVDLSKNNLRYIFENVYK